VLAGELDRYLAREYGVDPENKENYESWRASHQPFHWFAEFHGVMAEGGFDMVIGNPPYVEFRELGPAYLIRGYTTVNCGNLYAVASERALNLARAFTGRFGFIIPLLLSVLIDSPHSRPLL
jgi:methylase of polypeptide subunit release factors